MPDGGSHSADLAVAALAEAEFDPEILDRFANTNWRMSRRKGGLRIEQASFCGEGFAAFNENAGAQRAQSFFIRQTLNEDEIGFRDMVLGVEQSFVPLRLVGQKKQSLRVGIQAADRVDISGKVEIRQGAVGTAIRRELRKNAEGFVEGEDQRTFSRVRSWESTTPIG